MRIKPNVLTGVLLVRRSSREIKHGNMKKLKCCFYKRRKNNKYGNAAKLVAPSMKISMLNQLIETMFWRIKVAEKTVYICEGIE